MNENDNVNDAIQASLRNFTEKFEEVSSVQFDEMRKCSFFDPIPSEWLANIAKISKTVKFAPGAHITTENDVTKTFYVIIYGSATAYVNLQIVGHIHSGECIGEGAFFTADNLSRLATVIADGEVVAVEITKSSMDAIEGETQTYMNKALLLALYKKLKAANKKIVEMTHDKQDFV